MMNRTKITIGLYYLLYLVVYIGWLFHGSATPWILGYSKQHFGFLLIMLIPFMLPILFVRPITPSLMMIFKQGMFLVSLLYLFLAAYYYYTRTYKFDPFLQMPPPDISAEYGSSTNYRILILGGSTSTDYHNFLGDKLLEAYPNIKVEIINGARMWWTSKHSLIAYSTMYDLYDPDLVIIMHGINDLIRSCVGSAYSLGEYKEDYSHYYGAAINGAQPPNFVKYLFGRYLGAVQDNWYSSLRVSAADYSVERFKSLKSFQINIERLVKRIKSDGAGVILVTQPSLYKPDLSSQESAVLDFPRAFCMDRRDFFRMTYPSLESMRIAMQAFNDLIRYIGEQTGVYLVDADPIFEKSLRNFVDDVHYTKLGNEELSNIIYQVIKRANLISEKGV